MLRGVWALWAAVACGVLAGCGGGTGGTGGGTTSTTSSGTTSSSTPPPACGDGALDEGEACDDGNLVDGDGCSTMCVVESGYSCTGTPSGCKTVCGDGIIAGIETCDDGNSVPGDGCDAECDTEDGYTCAGTPSACATTCGDAILAGKEVCDDGNTDEGDGCSAACAVEAGFICDMASPTICASICGDGAVVVGEACDDNNTAEGDGCDKACAQEAGWTCTGAPSTCVTTCGDGVVAGAEGCDDGNLLDGDGCDMNCNAETGFTCQDQPSNCFSTCGDGIVAGNEACDDGNTMNTDGCDMTCTAVEPGWTCAGMPSACVPTCGDGIIAGPENCDDGNTAGGDGCAADCKAIEAGFTCTGMPSLCATTCGDGIVAGLETCDDGGTTSGNGCSATCTVESGYVCTGMPSACHTVCGDGIVAGAEVCDDYNSYGGDGCAADCGVIEIGFTCSGSPSLCLTTCGDGIATGGELCDDGNTADGDGCSATCSTELGFGCAGSPSVCAPLCGDGIKVLGEKCDDGNTVSGDCCSSTCQLEAGCEVEVNNTIAAANDFAALSSTNKIKGNLPVSDKDVFMVVVPAGKLGTITAETLDGALGTTCASLAIDSVVTVFDAGGNSVGSDDDNGPGYCSIVTVSGLVPGSYYIEVKGYSKAFDYTLQVTLSLATCGNSVVEVGEQCDDGNLTNGDGCTDLCKLEPLLESEPNDSCGPSANGPYPIPPNVLVAGGIDSPGDSDYYAITLSTWADLRVETFDATGPGSCESIDTKVQAFGPSCVALGAADDDGSLVDGACSLLDPTVSTQTFMQHLAPGTYYINVTAYSTSATFEYTVLATLVATCGNGVKEGSETCDGTPGCGADCRPIPGCGNGVVEAGEPCDDGNLVNGDGCSSTCTIEPNYACTGAPSTCVMPCAPGQTLVQYTSTDVPKTITDNTPSGAVSTIVVPASGTVQRVILQLNISHDYDADLDITLTSPAGTAIDVSSDNGGSGDNYTSTIFDDSCPAITAGTSPFSGCYSPEQAFSTLGGQQANGTWTLKAVDDDAGIAGTLNGWSMALCLQ